MRNSFLTMGISLLALSACGAQTEATVPTETAPTAAASVETATQFTLEDATGPFAWAVDYDQSTVRFTATGYGGEVNGSFAKFSARIVLDPDDPTSTGSINAIIDMSSLTGGTADSRENLPTQKWFDVQSFAAAEFTSGNIMQSGTDPDMPLYLAEGMLTIKGVSKPARLDFTLTHEGNHVVADGGFSMDRLEYGVGDMSLEIDQNVMVRVLIVADKTP